MHWMHSAKRCVGIDFFGRIDGFPPAPLREKSDNADLMSPLTIQVAVVLLALAAIVASWLAGRNFACMRDKRRGVRLNHGLVALCAVGCLSLWLCGWARSGWGSPVSSHGQGLLLSSGLLALALFYLQTRERLYAVSAFGSPILALLLIWAFCANTWTFRPFGDGADAPVLQFIHRVSVYLGTLLAALAAAMGGYYLLSQRRLKQATHLAEALEGASLETLENTLGRLAMGGFGLLSLGVLSGAALMWHQHTLGSLDLAKFIPIIAITGIAWAMYALVIHPPFVALSSRGRAWLAMLGFLLILAATALVLARIAGGGHGGAG